MAGPPTRAGRCGVCLEAIRPTLVRQWQNQLAGQLGYESLMACRSIMFRILQLAEDEGAITANPVRKVPAPKQRVDPDQVFAEANRRALTPDEAGRLLARFPLFWWDHMLCLLGTGLRFGEYAGLRHRRVHLDRVVPVLQVVDTQLPGRPVWQRLQAPPQERGRLPRGPPRPPGRRGDTSPAPARRRARRAGLHRPWRRQRRTRWHADDPVAPRLPRLYQSAVRRASTDLAHLQLRGPHDLRHTFSTWLEDTGIPARVIDELMGHQRSRHGDLDGGSRIGARYRHTTDEMAARVVDAIEARLQIVLRVAEEATQAEPDRKSFRVF